MNKLFIVTLLLITIGQTALGQEKFSLDEIIALAKEQSPSAKQAETRKQNLYWQYRLFRSNYNPQLLLTGQLPGLRRGFFQRDQDDGGTIAVNTRITNTNLGLGLVQPIPQTGGSISVNTGFNVTTTFDSTSIRGNVPSWNSNVFEIALNQPIFAFNQLKWDKKIEPLRYEASKKGFVEDMEFVARIAVERYFDYLEAQVSLRVAEFNLANNDTIYNIEKGRYNIGTTSKDKLLQVELQLLRSRRDVARAALDLQSSKLGLNSFVGLTNVDFDLVLPQETPVFQIDVEEALLYARGNRSSYVNFEQRRLVAARNLAQAKGERFQINLRASIGRSGFGDLFNEAVNDLSELQTANITLQVPVLNWGRNEASIKTAIAEQQLTEYTIRQEELDFDQEIITLVGRMNLLRAQLDIAFKSDSVAQARYAVSQNRYLIGKIDITNLNIALQEKDASKIGYVQALREFWTAFYDLRRLTLYDFVNRQLLYTEE